MSQEKLNNQQSEKQIKQISLFYRYLKPTATSQLIYSEALGKYSSEKLMFTPTLESFVKQTLAFNKTGDCFAARNRFKAERKTQFVNFLKTWVIDIDNDEDNSKSTKFEEVCKKYDIKIEAKAESRPKGGYHYYLPYKPTTITDDNREQMKDIGRNFRDWLMQEHNLDIDARIFDLPRLIRIWGSYNHKRKGYCRLLYLHTVDDEAINQNTNFINSLTKRQLPKLPSVSSLVTSCRLIEHVRNNKLDKENTEKNDKLLKNVAIFLYSLMGDDGYQIGEQITVLQGHNPAEFTGWWKKAQTGELKDFGCGELFLWLERHYKELLSMTCSKCRVSNQNKVEYLDSRDTFKALKQLSRDRGKLLINKELFLKGIVAPTAMPYKQEIIVFKTFNREVEGQNQRRIVFFDEKPPRGTAWEEQSSFSADFFPYDLIEENINYMLLSENKLEYGEYYIEGSAVKLTDKILIGNYGTVGAKRKIILLHNARNVIQKINSHDELFSKVKNFGREDFINYIFTAFDEDTGELCTYPQPENIVNLVTSFLFSAKFEFPLHLCIYGKQDSGKSTILRAVFEMFNEPYTLVDGANSKLKGLVPSFAGSKPELGVILESKRICAIDEFFRIIKDEKDDDRISCLNNFLLHTKYANRTGKGMVEAKMRSKLFTVTNPIYGCNFQDTINRLPPSTIDRILIWKQYKSHYEWVRRGNKIFKANNKIDKYTFLSVYDYLNSFKISFSKDKVLAIVDKIKAKIPSYMEGLYDSRYGNHHSICLLDGLVKLRCISENDKSFKANSKDYEAFERLWEDLAIGWHEAINAEEADKFLTQEQKAFYKLVKENQNTWDYQLQKLCEEKNINFEHNYKRLLDLKLIEIKNRKISVPEEQDLTFG